MKAKAVIISLIFIILSFALARVNFELSTMDASNFSDYEKRKESCNTAPASSFWCSQLEDNLSLIPTKGTDFVFNEAGELMALFAKQQKGQNYVGRNGGYNQGIDNNINLVPFAATFPAGAILFDGEYRQPEVLESRWDKTSNTDYLGTFSLKYDDVMIEKTVGVSNLTHTLKIELQAVVTESTGANATTEVPQAISLQYAIPGIAKNTSPLIKIGQGDKVLTSFTQAIPNPRYISLQTGANRGNAVIMRSDADPDLSAEVLPTTVISLKKLLPAEVGARTLMKLELYGGPNELVRFYQEGLKDLPGLFKPNILGQMSLGMLWVLERLHTFLGSWGLAIMGLTLLFRIAVWPLINTQTKSMYAMQRLQPKMQELQKKYKDDREKLTQETMKLYKQEGVNPAGGCFPMLLQMPLFIILWRVFANFEFNEGFLWIPDLGQADPLFILPILYVGIIFAQSYFMSQGNKQTLQQQMLMNAVFIFFVINFPAGVTLYWVVSMSIQVLQYYLIQRNRPAPVKAT